LPSAAVRHRDHPLVRRAALAGGDDYELAFTAPAGLSTEMGALAARAGVALTRVGRVDQGSGVAVVDGAGRTIVLTETGFDHFR
jgi:thiamine-monophosphate kinase